MLTVHVQNAGRDCPSFTYHELERECMIYTSNAASVTSLAFLPSAKTDFNVRTAVKFCYPESLRVFEQCSEFVAFRDYTLDVEPREIFDDMPRSRDGLHACIELCVLAPNFHCKVGEYMRR
ncbi:unnamed protein product [Gongylonema pulchrum]|uniref:Apple domain-containing protein n=1 Tax=Gongylonema pulchrum TaxID=637853 RepID=A0A183DCX0_9BILA|nr:unnamed protein product [Gongylonema pulchrum]